MKPKNLNATAKDNAKQAAKAAKRKKTGKLSDLQKAAVKASNVKKKQEEYLVNKALNDNAKAKKQKERAANRKRR